MDVDGEISDMTSRRESLESRRADIDHAILMEMKRPLPDSLKLQRLKKQKLALKDQL